MAGKSTAPKTKAASTSSKSSETKLVRELATILEETNLSEIEIEKGTLRIRVARTLGQMTAMAPAIAAPQIVAQPALAPAIEAPAPDKKSDAGSHPGVVKSPMVGTAYTRPSPDSDSFAKVGDSVKKGDTVLLIEAMKTFNPIVADKSGKILELLIEDAQPVEFGEPLFIIV